MNKKNKLRTSVQRFCSSSGLQIVVAVPVMALVFYAVHRWTGLEWLYAVILGSLVSFFLVPIIVLSVMIPVAWFDSRMRLFKKRPTERLVIFLKEDCRPFWEDIDVNHFLARIEEVGALVAVREFLEQANARNMTLPPGYWGYFERLKKELEKDESHT